MHEYSLALEISGIAEKKTQNKKILEINLSIGTLTGIYDESLIFYLDEIYKAKYGHVIKITTEMVNAEFECDCGKKYSTESMFTPCPFCGEFGRTVINGNDCIIKNIITE